MASTPYRDGRAQSVPPIVVRYVAFTRYELVRFGLLAVLGTIAIRYAPPERIAAIVLGVACFALILAAMTLPVVTLSARVEGKFLVVRGRRFPGAEVLWSCTLDEAESFEVVTQVDERSTRSHHVALKVMGTRLLPLTEHAYPGVGWIYGRVLRRMNAWLDRARVDALREPSAGRTRDLRSRT